MNTLAIRALATDLTTRLAVAVRATNTRSGTYYDSLDEFVEQYLSEVYPMDNARTEWCPSWWQHPDAVVVLQTLWASFEHHRLDTGSGMAVWFRDYLWPLMDRLTSSRTSPFGQCSSSKHGGQPSPLPTVAPPADWFRPPLDPKGKR